MTNPSSSARWSGSDYSRSSAHHRGYDEMFLARHQPRPSDAVVDLGCGVASSPPSSLIWSRRAR